MFEPKIVIYNVRVFFDNFAAKSYATRGTSCWNSSLDNLNFASLSIK